jgi:hypothetical protein
MSGFLEFSTLVSTSQQWLNKPESAAPAAASTMTPTSAYIFFLVQLKLA